MQEGVNKRTELYHDEYKGEQAPVPGDGKTDKEKAHYKEIQDEMQRPRRHRGADRQDPQGPADGQGPGRLTARESPGPARSASEGRRPTLRWRFGLVQPLFPHPPFDYHESIAIHPRREADHAGAPNPPRSAPVRLRRMGRRAENPQAGDDHRRSGPHLLQGDRPQGRVRRRDDADRPGADVDVRPADGAAAQQPGVGGRGADRRHRAALRHVFRQEDPGGSDAAGRPEGGVPAVVAVVDADQRPAGEEPQGVGRRAGQDLAQPRRGGPRHRRRAERGRGPDRRRRRVRREHSLHAVERPGGQALAVQDFRDGLQPQAEPGRRRRAVPPVRRAPRPRHGERGREHADRLHGDDAGRRQDRVHDGPGRQRWTTATASATTCRT